MKRSRKAVEKRSDRKFAALKGMNRIDPFRRLHNIPYDVHSYQPGWLIGISSAERDAEALIAKEIEAITRVAESDSSLLGKSIGASLRADPTGTLARPEFTTPRAKQWGFLHDSIQGLKRIRGSRLVFLIDAAEGPGLHSYFARRSLANIFSYGPQFADISSYKAYSKTKLMRVRDNADIAYTMKYPARTL
jgi:hypothetical protein